ncbi:toxic anion resistance protein [Streptococcus dysgalactiae subsp. equisimilis]|uniref:Tellurite resistance protein n=1 Tax=Streptococcus dysgalactiae TaxID=1334 RepID=A0A9X9SHQ3_STRDY|nr:toxic anion resistance protein [Streptococcus dysgalactiae]ADX23686.1 putative toxic anion resistance protein [Streptococcus dysgalactiae subsp. equisimilis ATCC 12394]MCY7234130.1 toxic anion resistance protein [Streptococcus dysgalactiae]SQB82649.1 tellurite resistance protein [Streptococcus dysgalactiae]VTS19231.1 tellurite resistance protein [Streptococcus dysgalactiae subsp. equisimilis]VTS45485.1 tellurite resistance protein [Streptococcus dysgalactiae subsp. equisimilis]
MAEFHFDIDQIADNAIVKTDKTTDIISELPTNTTGQISFFEKLSADQQTAITAKAPALVDTFLADQNALLDFGQSAVEGVNATVNHILAEQKKLQIPQVDDLLKSTNRELNGFIAKYKDATPADLEKKPNLIQKLFKQSRDTLQEFYFDSQNIEQKMDGMAATVVKQEDTLARNIVSAELLIEDNTKSIENLVGVIAFIEASQKEATTRALTLQQKLATLDSATPEYQVQTDLLARTTEVINTLEQQHTEYLSRLYVAWATTPQMRNLVKVSSDMRQKLGMLRRNTIPTMKLSIAQLGMMQQSVKSGMTADAIVNANNAALQMLAETSKEAIPALEQSAQNPTLSMKSVTSLAESLVAQNNGIIAAIDHGRKERAQLESAIIKSAETINDSVKLRDQNIVQALLNEGKETQRTVEKETAD